MAQKGHIIETGKDIVKDPYVMEFLGLSENHRYSEKKLEEKIIDNLQMFLLELGKGFTFVGRQYRITLNNRHYYIDLVFYHRILKCFVLIDLKIGFVDHGDIGQMNMYLNYFKKEEGVEDDNESVEPGFWSSPLKDANSLTFKISRAINRRTRGHIY